MFVSSTVVVRLSDRGGNLVDDNIPSLPMRTPFARLTAAVVGCAQFAASAALAMEVADLTTEDSPAYRVSSVHLAPVAPVSLRMAGFDRSLSVH